MMVEMEKKKPFKEKKKGKEGREILIDLFMNLDQQVLHFVVPLSVRMEGQSRRGKRKGR